MRAISKHSSDGEVACEDESEGDQSDGGPILVAGSATLVQSLVENDLVDELRLMVFPVIGGPKRLFPESQQKPFKLTDSQTFDSGVAVQT